MDKAEKLEKAVREALNHLNHALTDELPATPETVMAQVALQQALTPEPQFKTGDWVQVRHKEDGFWHDGIYIFESGEFPGEYYCAAKSSDGTRVCYNFKDVRPHPTKRNVTFHKHDGNGCPVESGTLVYVMYQSSGQILRAPQPQDEDWSKITQYAIWSDDNE